MSTTRPRTRLSVLLSVWVVVTAGFTSWQAKPATQSGPPSASPTPVQEGSAAARRSTLHSILDRAKGADDGVHDACGALVEVGDSSSVPHLIRALRLFPDIEIKGKPGEGIVCTQGHCVAALERLTGAKVGVSYSSWKRWWDASHPQQPLGGPPNNRLKQTARGRSGAELLRRTRAAA